MERIHVSVRARPLSAEDAKASPWRINGNAILLPNQSSKFEFDRIFLENSKTGDVYLARTRDIVAAAVGGFNGTVFAYGQTSSGKTYTMRGTNSEPGVIHLAVHDLFNMRHQDIDREYLLRMSYMEIYNEEINDLLAPEHRRLQIHESIERGIFVAGLREEIVASADQVLKLMDFGEAHRHFGETNMNLYSSRSHTIFRMIIESRLKSEEDGAEFSCDAVRVSVLNLVDLAGSERASKTGAEGVRLKEGSHINKSLLTLGTVIKKLSEGAESQGGHVPYRDSKLTRILQPALGGNANTAIICNITLAQIHVDETKNSLQFASRALHVTNCAHVNEILNDAALLKRQKKEIEELRAKLQGLRSEHLEEETLNLRNTLLKSELERERIALELEEEKRAQAEREKRLQEQAKKIENLSSMVIFSTREETVDAYKKEKRRDTWCPGNLLRKNLKELSAIREDTSAVKFTRADCMVGPLFPFQELVERASTSEFCNQDKDSKENASGDCSLPDPRALLRVTTRRKVSNRERNLSMENNESAEYDNLLIEFETNRIISYLKIDYLMKKLTETGLGVYDKYGESSLENAHFVSHPDGNRSLRDSDAICVIKQLQDQEKIAVLELVESSSQKKFDTVFDLANEQSISAQEKYEQLYGELMLAKEDAVLAHEKLASLHSSREESDWLNSLLSETEEMSLELENSRHLTASLFSTVDEILDFSSMMPSLMLDLRASASQCSGEMEAVVRSHKRLLSYLRKRVHDLVNEKLVLTNQVMELQSSIEELTLGVRHSADAFTELSEKYEGEKSDFLCELELLQREISSLSSSSLAKEKENIRKDLERTKLKLKDTEFKLKNAMQEKTKLEGEKSYAEKEIKRLQSQKVMLERDMNKRESIIGRKSNSTIERNSNIFDQKRGKDSAAWAELEEEYKKLECLAFDMEGTIASLEEQLTMANEEKDVAASRAESLVLDLQALSEELDLSKSELRILKEDVSELRSSEEEFRFQSQKLEDSLRILSEVKEDLSMQLTEALMTLEEEKALWASKEKTSLEVIGEKEKLHTTEIASLSQQLAEARSERQCLLAQVQELKKQSSTEDSEVVKLKQELEEQRLLVISLEEKMRKEKTSTNKERAQLKLQLRGTALKLDCFRTRYNESIDELEYMNKKYEEAAAKLKKQLASYGCEILNLKKKLVETQGQ